MLDKKNKVPGGTPPPQFHHPPEILRLYDPLLFSKAEGPFHGDPCHLSAESILFPCSGVQNLNGQPFSPLHSPPFQNISTALATHPFQETMSPLPPKIAGLICPFH